MQNRLILFDIDYTLFDTTIYRDKVAKALENKLPNLPYEKVRELVEKTYYEIRSLGNFHPKSFATSFEKHEGHNLSAEEIEAIWWDTNIIKNAIYAETLPVLKELQKLPQTALGIFSTGVDELQLAKIDSISNFFQKEHIHIFSIKDERLSEIVKQYDDFDLIFIDDMLGILRKVKGMNSKIMTIWMRRGIHAQKEEITDFQPDFIATSLQELPSLIS